MTTPIVLIHGLWLTARSWEGWKERFEQRRHEVLTPAWPRMEGEVEALRRDPSVMKIAASIADQTAPERRVFPPNSESSQPVHVAVSHAAARMRVPSVVQPSRPCRACLRSGTSRPCR